MKKSKPYDLEERTFEFAKDVRLFVKNLKPTISNIEDSKQVVRSSGSVGANYIEANENVGDKDFIFRARISKKEAKESQYWLRLIKETNSLNSEEVVDDLIDEAGELRKILSSIIQNRLNNLNQ